jgi:beta-lactamase regulating signal transducer with metallopeptidase domain
MMNVLEMSVFGGEMIIVVALLRLALERVLPRRTFSNMWTLIALRLLIPYSPFVKAKLPGADFVEKTQTVILDRVNSAVSRVPNASRIWIIGAGAGLFLVLCAYFHYVSLFRRAAEINREDIWWEPEKPLRRGITLKSLSGLRSPTAYGLFKPTIFVRPGEDAHTAAATYALEREYFDLRRLNCVKKFLLVTALAVHWFNPLVWLMYLTACTDLELATDQATVNRYGVAQREFIATSVLNLAESVKGLPKLFPSFGYRVTKKRIGAIMTFRYFTFLHKFPAFVLLMAVLAAMLVKAA